VSDSSLLKLLENIQIAIALLIVCVPEGLPLAISIAMAFSIDRLKEDNLLVKDLASLETAGALIDIMTGKTGTLTYGDMNVQTFHAGGDFQENAHPSMNQELFQTIKSLIVLNTDARMEIEDMSSAFVPQGSPVEVGLLRFLIDNDEPVQNRLVERES